MVRAPVWDYTQAVYAVPSHEPSEALFPPHTHEAGPHTSVLPIGRQRLHLSDI